MPRRSRAVQIPLPEDPPAAPGPALAPPGALAPPVGAPEVPPSAPEAQAPPKKRKARAPKAAAESPAEPPKLPAAEWVDPRTLVAWGENPRRNETAIPKVRESILRFGFGAPIIARASNKEVIAGHTRLAATLELLATLDNPDLDKKLAAQIRKRNLGFVPVRYLDLSEEDARLLALADNRLGEFAEWDDARLAAVLTSYRGLDANVAAVAGFSDADIDLIVKGLRIPDPAEIAATHGGIDDPSTWPDIKIRVPPETFRAYQHALAAMPGNEAHEKFAALLAAAEGHSDEDEDEREGESPPWQAQA